MNFQQALKHVEGLSRNINLQWFICKWNDGYIVHSSTYMRRHPDTIYEYSTGPLNKTWKLVYDKTEKRFKHISD